MMTVYILINIVCLERMPQYQLMISDHIEVQQFMLDLITILVIHTRVIRKGLKYRKRPCISRTLL